MPPNVKENNDDRRNYVDGVIDDKDESNDQDRMPKVETYRPMSEEPVRRMSVYQWLKGKARDDAIG